MRRKSTVLVLVLIAAWNALVVYVRSLNGVNTLLSHFPPSTPPPAAMHAWVTDGACTGPAERHYRESDIQIHFEPQFPRVALCLPSFHFRPFWASANRRNPAGYRPVLYGRMEPPWAVRANYRIYGEHVPSLKIHPNQAQCLSSSVSQHARVWSWGYFTLSSHFTVSTVRLLSQLYFDLL